MSDHDSSTATAKNEPMTRLGFAGNTPTVGNKSTLTRTMCYQLPGRRHFQLEVHLAVRRLPPMVGRVLCERMIEAPCYIRGWQVIILGDSAVGKSKLVERYLMDEYNPRQLSTFALTLFRKNARLGDGTEVKVGEWRAEKQKR